MTVAVRRHSGRARAEVPVVAYDAVSLHPREPSGAAAAVLQVEPPTGGRGELAIVPTVSWSYRCVVVAVRSACACYPPSQP